MNFKIFSLSFALAAVATLSSCGDDWQPGDGSQFPAGTGGAYSGTINVEVASEPTKAQSRADATVDYSSFLVTVTPKGSDEIATFDGDRCSWTYGNMPEIFTLPVGEYTVHVKSHEPEAVAWSAPYFEGQTDFTVVSNKVVNIGKVHCSFRSLKIGVVFDEDFLKLMDHDNSSVTVTAGSAGTSEKWTAGETRCAYFYLTEDNPSVVAHFGGVIDGQSYSAGKTIQTAKAGDYYIFTFSLNQGNPVPPEEFGSTVVPASGINIDVDMIREDINNQLKPGEDINTSDEKHPNAEEWPDPVGPGTDPENPDDPTPPTPSDDPGVKMNAPGISLNGVNDIVDGKKYFVEFNTEAPITGMTVKIVSPYLTESFLAEAGLPTVLDLGNPGDLESTLSGDPNAENEEEQGFGLKTGADILGKNYVPFDLTGLIPLLNADDNSDVHEFIVTITTEGRPDFVQSLKFRNLK